MDFEVLRQNIKKAAKQAFSEMVERHKADEIYAFALYRDEGAMTVCPSTNTLSSLSKADPEDAPYHKFAPGEWKYEAISGHLLHSTQKLRSLSGGNLVASMPA